MIIRPMMWTTTCLICPPRDAWKLGGTTPNKRTRCQHCDVPLKKVIPARVLEAANFRVVRALLDHGARQTFREADREVAGSWTPDLAGSSQRSPEQGSARYPNR